MQVEDITENGEQVGDTVNGVPFHLGGYVLEYSGAWYPFDAKGMLNPLDPVNLVLCWPVNPEGGDDDGDFESVLDTAVAVTWFRKKGFEVVTSYKSGAARTVRLLDGSDRVVILGDYAKEHRLILPILSTQLSAAYDQSAIDLWKSLGFQTPPHYGAWKNENTYSVDGWHGPALLDGKKTVTYYNIIGGGRKVTVKKTHVDAEVQEISDDDGRDWDYGYFERTTYEVSVAKFEDRPSLKTAPFHGTTPQFRWEDKR